MDQTSYQGFPNGSTRVVPDGVVGSRVRQLNAISEDPNMYEVDARDTPQDWRNNTSAGWGRRQTAFFAGPATHRTTYDDLGSYSASHQYRGGTPDFCGTLCHPGGLSGYAPRGRD